MLAAGLVVVMVSAAMLLVPAASPRRVVAGPLEAENPSFHTVPAATPAAPPGTLVRSEELFSAPAGARAWRALYHSTDLAGRDAVVSGIVVAPQSPRRHQAAAALPVFAALPDVRSFLAGGLAGTPSATTC
jgi:hypothetical protein